jgi:hypothetical protein
MALVYGKLHPPVCGIIREYVEAEILICATLSIRKPVDQEMAPVLRLYGHIDTALSTCAFMNCSNSAFFYNYLITPADRCA